MTKHLKNLLDSIVFDIRYVQHNSKEEHTVKNLEKIVNDLSEIQALMIENESSSFVKKILYKRMVELRKREPILSRTIYELYQQLKDKMISPDDALLKCNELIVSNNDVEISNK